VANKITIRNEDEAERFLEEFFRSEKEFQSLDIFFDGWPNLCVKIVGQDYKSSLKSSQLKALLKLQETLYYQYELLTGRKSSALSLAERKFLELNVRVGNGSSELKIDLEPILNAIISSGISSNFVLFGLVAIGLVFGGIKVADRVIEFRKDQTRRQENERRERELDLLVGQPRPGRDLPSTFAGDLVRFIFIIKKLEASAADALVRIVECASDSDDIYINGSPTKHLREEIRGIGRGKRASKSASSFVKGRTYRRICSVVGIRDEGGGLYECRFKVEASEEVLIWVEKKSNVASSLDHMLRAAFNNKKATVPVSFQIVSELRGSFKIVASEIFDKKPRSFKAGH